MISKEEKTQRMIKVARLYYEENKSQQEIAKELGISRPLVSIILTEAKERGVVTIAINDTRWISAEQIAEKIRNIYKINTILIVPDDKNDGQTNRKVAETAFGHFFSKANEGKRSGIGWGSIIGRMADYANTLETLEGTSGMLFPLAGGINTDRVKTQALLLEGLLCGLAGSFFWIVVEGAIVTAGLNSYEFLALAGAVLGGVSLLGGRGSVFPGAVIGSLILLYLAAGMANMGISIFITPFVRGVIIFIAMYIDSLRTRKMMGNKMA